jgi:hypothetical protein
VTQKVTTKVSINKMETVYSPVAYCLPNLAMNAQSFKRGGLGSPKKVEQQRRNSFSLYNAHLRLLTLKGTYLTSTRADGSLTQLDTFLETNINSKRVLISTCHLL